MSPPLRICVVLPSLPNQDSLDRAIERCLLDDPASRPTAVQLQVALKLRYIGLPLLVESTAGRPRSRSQGRQVPSKAHKRARVCGGHGHGSKKDLETRWA